ncbi:titin homolog isoform X2 [Trichomycterus rosablanca]|uniref:titin homolog isoform X2 n=1 Tax=Trichomycterus rosablanca TaxID=2290929 RepID=UPI002F35E003
MTSRRPMIRSYSSNGRTGSQNGDNAPSPRLDGRNYLSSVRPENRSTFCTVMSQLTEETQPCFETTIKSKAVSEECNVKFTCVVTGYPIPELTWYKDDMELDRYCGLPKYEIHRNGKTHTLHIYNCTMDDAAIYQASARNSKGIVSCSGVLEVGTMSEFKIHQRFFAKLKQKADLKRRELDESRRQVKENVQQEQLGINQDNAFRNTRLQVEHSEVESPSVQDREDIGTQHEKPAVKKTEALKEEMNGLLVQPPISNDSQQKNSVLSQENDRQMISVLCRENGNQQLSMDGTQENGNQELIHVCEKAESGTTQSKATVIRKNIRISNGFDETLTTKSIQGAGGRKDTHEAISLAKFLVDSSQSQSNEEPHKTLETSQHSVSTDTSKNQAREHEKDTEKIKAEEMERSQERSREHKQERSSIEEKESRKRPDYEHKALTASDAKAPLVHKEPDHQHKSALSSVFHSLKDIFFGKGKKDTDSSKNLSDLTAEKEESITDSETHLHISKIQPRKPESTSGLVSEKIVPMEGGQQLQNGEPYMNRQLTQDTPHLLEINTEAVSLKPGDNSLVSTTNNTEHLSQTLHHESVDTKKETYQDQGHLKKEEEVSSESWTKTPLFPCFEATDDHIEVNKDGGVVDLPCETVEQECTATKDQMTQAGGEMHAVKEQDDTPDFTLEQAANLPGPNRTELRATESNPEAQLSQSVSHVSCVVPSKTENKKDIMVDENTECTSDTRDTSVAPVVEKAAEKDILKPQEGFSVTNESKNKIHLEKEGATVFLKKSMKDGVEVSGSLNEGACESDSNIQEEANTENTHFGKDQPTKSISTDSSVSKQKIQSEFDGIEANLGLRQNKARIYTKSQSERHVESRDQFAVPQIIILPDTRETVIKNVAKMRSTPPTPEIKVTVPEKVKHEESINDPGTDILVSEHEKVIQPLKDKESQSEKPVVNATIAPNESKNNNIVIITESVNDTPVQQDRNVDGLPSDQRNQSVKPQNLEAVVCKKDEPAKISSGWSRGNGSSSIPTISIACADDVTSSNEHEKPAHDTVHTDNANKVQALSSEQITHVENTAEQNKEASPDSLANMLRKAVSNLDYGVSPDTGGAEKAALQKGNNMSERVNLTAIQPGSVKTLQNVTCIDTDKVCTDKEIKTETDADKLQRDKPAMEKLGLTTPVGPTLPPLSPASLRRLMAKNNPNLESQGSTSAASGDGCEKKGEDSGGSTPTSTLSCESSPKMKRRDSLTLIPSATPEELASGARRKIYLAKTKSEDEGSESQSKRDSPYMSPSQARRAALLQLQSGQQTPPMEKRSPLLVRRKATLEVPKPKEEVSEEITGSNMDSKPEEKEKLDPYKAPQVIRKIRGESFSDAMSHLKLWCQFFNVLSDSTIKWFKDEIEIAEIKRSAGDESQVALAIVQASNRDCGVYSCTIKNEYGNDTTDYLLSSEILAEFFLRDDLEGRDNWNGRGDRDDTLAVYQRSGGPWLLG